MTETKQLEKVVQDLVEVMHFQAKEIERLVSHLEQVTSQLPYRSEFPVIASELSELRGRIQKLQAPRRQTSGEKSAVEG